MKKLNKHPNSTQIQKRKISKNKSKIKNTIAVKKAQFTSRLQAQFFLTHSSKGIKKTPKK